VSLWLICSLWLVSPVPLHAGKKKTDAIPTPANPGDQRVKAYFDITKIVWPQPPDIARVAFKDIYTGQKIDPSLFIKKARKKTWMDRLAGALPADQIDYSKLPLQLIRTYGVGVDSNGKIYAADQGVGGVFIFDPQNKGRVELIGNGRQANFGMIAGLALDDDDRLFVSDTSLRHVVVFSPKHEQEAIFGADVLVRPAGVAIDRENRFVYVADTGNDVVDVFDADNYNLLRQIGKPSKKHDQTAPGTFSLPEGVAVDGDGNVFVTDTFNDRIEMFDADAQFISAFGKNGDGPADFERPKGIAIDCDGHIWVVDATQNRVKVFDNQGRLLIYFGGAGYYPGQFMGPWGIAIGPSNQVVVSETFPGRVQVFRYVTDAEAAAEKARREAAGKKPAAAQASTPSADARPKPAAAATADQKEMDVGAPAQAQKPPSAGAPEQKKPATVPPSPDLAAKKDSPAQ
jgi:DNA-binding beta-propeller fold protein YncE